MRRDTNIKNAFYTNMLKEVKSLKYDSQNKEKYSFGALNDLWHDGGFDEFSDDHFMIRAFDEDVEYFKAFFRTHYIQKTYASAPYVRPESFPGVFLVNLDNSFQSLISYFGYDKIRRFVTDQLSAGKEKYDEEVFFEALSEIHILSFFCKFGGMSAISKEPIEFDEKGLIKIEKEPIGIKSAEYEPRLNGNCNPEARFYYEDGTVLDIEIKTPRFTDNVEEVQSILMPGVMLNGKGRSILKDTCEENGIKCLLPNVSKMKQYLNSAETKFNDPESDKHINLLCINWTGATVDKNDITEPLIILTNDTNGILAFQESALKCQVSKAALDKVSAVLLYKIELGALLFSDFRFIFANGKARVVLNRFSKHLNPDVIHRITKLSCIYPEESNISSMIYANDECLFESKEEIALAEKVVRENILL